MPREQTAPINKAEMRNYMLRSRRAASAESLAVLSDMAQAWLLRQDIWKNARSIAAYKPTQNEVETEMLLKAAERECKQVFLPRVRKGRKGEMDFALCRGPHELVRGAYNILEPAPGIPACIFTSEDECARHDNIKAPWPDLFIIPGVAFDRKGRRIGYGGGYYDRFLANPLLREHCLFIGLAYSFQIVDAILPDGWDELVDALCTDVGFEFFRS